MVVAETPVVLGCQEPRIQSVPEHAASRGEEVLELGERCGISADPWQALVVDAMFGLRDDGLFSAFKVGINVPRQNGKGTLLELRELGGIFVLGEKLITHTSHMQDTSLEAMNRLVEALEEGELQGEIKGKPRYANGQEAIIFKSGQRIRFRTRSKSAGRGWTADCVILDEAMFVPEFAHNAVIPILSTLKNPQVIYAGSAADQQVHEQATVWAKLREQASAGVDDSDRLAYFEWSAPFDDPDEMPDVLDMEMIALANPALGIRITPEYILEEHKTLDRRGFATERAGVGDWPRTDGVRQNLVAVEDWQELFDESSELGDVFVFAVDVSPERVTSIAAAGYREDGQVHVELIQHRGGTSWLPKWLVERVAMHEPVEVVADGVPSVTSVLPAVLEAGVTVREFGAAEFAQACSRLVDAVKEKTLRHRGQDELLAAIKGAKARPLGDAWAWSRKNSSVDISPLVAVTLALSAALDNEGHGDFTIY